MNRAAIVCFFGLGLLLPWNLVSFANENAALEKQLSLAGKNRDQLEKALALATQAEKKGMEFLVANMPEADLQKLGAEFLLENARLAYQARKETPWGQAPPEEIFLNHVLPYANVDEKRDPWRKEFHELCLPMVKECKTATEAVQKLNGELFKTLKVNYSPQRRAPNLSPKESLAQGNASCTGLSIILVNACRAVGIPARLVGTPNWIDKRGNHTWVEIWDEGWHFTGACEPDPKGLNRGWFTADASKAIQDSPEHAIFAVTFAKSKQHFPLVWARNDKSIPGENVTSRYTPKAAPAKLARVSIKVLNAEKKTRRPGGATVPPRAGEIAGPGNQQRGNRRPQRLPHF